MKKFIINKIPIQHGQTKKLAHRPALGARVGGFSGI
jgi:hypothetical protein